MSFSAQLNPDEWAAVTEINPVTGIGCTTYTPRPAEEVARLKAERERAREDAVLAEADAIRARRAQANV